MRNLKKILALVLALVMSLSLVTMANADFSDAADIEKTEAVEVMAEIGILVGSNGAFDPQGTLTRAQAAKMITYMLLGADDAEKQVTKTVFGDVKVTDWFAGYVAYCASEGIINGVTANSFAPNANVTGYQYIKMLLCALGYDAAEKGLTGDAWAINAGKYYVAEGLDTNMDGIDLNADLAREDAAQLTLNAMKWTDEGSVWQYSDGTKTYSFETKSDAQIFYALESAAGKSWIGEVKTTEGSLLNDVYEVTATRGVDSFGRPANVYALNDDDSTVLTYADKADATFVGPVSEKALYAKLAKVADVSGTKAIAQVWEDGDAKASGFSVDKKVSNTAPYSANGVTMELFKLTAADGTVSYRVVAVRDYLGKVTTVNKATDDAKRSIVVELDILSSGYESEKTCANYETEDFAKDDIVVVNVAAEGAKPVIKAIAKAEKVENATVTGYKKGGVDVATLTADGTAYKYSQNTTVTTTSATYDMANKTYDLYLDTYGNVLKTEVYSEKASTDYFFVAAVTTENSKVDAFDASKTYDSYKLVGMDGKVVTVKAIDGASNANVANQYDIVTYAADEDNEGYVKITVKTPVTGTAAKLNKTAPLVATGIVADGNTVFVLETKAGEYKVVTGIANVPAYDSIGNTAYAIKDDKGYADVIFLSVVGKDAASSVADDLAYLFASTSTDASYDSANKKTIYAYSAIVDGKVETIYSQKADLTYTGLVKITKYDSYGYVDTVATAAGDLYNTSSLSDKAIALSAPTLLVDETSYLTTADTVVYMIDGDDVLTVATLADLVGTKVNGTITLIETSTTDATIATIYFDGTVADA